MGNTISEIRAHVIPAIDRGDGGTNACARRYPHPSPPKFCLTTTAQASSEVTFSAYLPPFMLDLIPFLSSCFWSLELGDLLVALHQMHVCLFVNSNYFYSPFFS